MDAGSAAVKVFPAARLGPAYFKDLLGPYPDAQLVATGGINTGNAAEYLAAGAIAATAGSGVVSPDLAAESRLDEIRQRAVEFVAAVANPS
jgi:2-dehydro-3-deoxyphosphogluconate aldolase/(4S)-4-hydroxy-2-oxoglutarate aldolase